MKINIDNTYKQILNLVVQELNSSLLKKGSLEIINDPNEYNQLKQYLVSKCILFAAQKIIVDKKITFRPIKDSLSISSFVTLMENNRSLKLKIEAKIKDVSFESINSFKDLSFLYEKLLSTDFTYRRGKIEFTESKHDRNIQGAHFTPIEFAENCVATALHDFIHSKLGLKVTFNKTKLIVTELERDSIIELITNSSVADISCGVGSFLLSYLNLIEELFFNLSLSISQTKSLLKKITKNLYGMDIDYIALDLAQLLIAEKTSFKSFVFYKNFFQCNPLIRGISGTKIEKIKSFNNKTFFSQTLYQEESVASKTFDIIIGNPPWEKIRLEERSFFSAYVNDFHKLTSKLERERLINGLKKSNIELFEHYEHVKNSIVIARKEIKGSNLFKETSKGELNTYSLFTELSISLVKPKGIIALIVKTGLLTTKVNEEFFANLIVNKMLYRVADYVNSKKIFQIDSRERFCLIVILQNEANYFFYSGIQTKPSSILDFSKYWNYKFKSLELFNPLTRMLTQFSSRDESNFLKKIVVDNSFLGDEIKGASYGRLVHFTSHRDSIIKENKKGYIPIFEGKFIEQYDGRFSTFEGISQEERFSSKASSRILSDEEKRYKVPKSRYFISRDKWKDISKNYKEKYSLIWRSTTSNTNYRTCIATILNFQPTSQSIQFLQSENKKDLIFGLCILNSFTFDYILRRKLPGIDVTQSVLKQVPVPEFKAFKSTIEYKDKLFVIEDMLVSLVKTIFKKEGRIKKFFVGMAYLDEIKNIETKKAIILINSLISTLYNITESEFKFLLLDFRISKKERHELIDSFNKIHLSE